MFLFAGVMKLSSLYEFRTTVDVIIAQALGGTPAPLALIRDLTTATLPALEIAVGLSMILLSGRPRLPAVAACLLLLGFSGILALLFRMDAPPRCGCFGSWELLRSDAKSSAAFGLMRNTGFLLIAGWLAWDRKEGRGTCGTPAPSGRSTRRLGASPPGFTLVELIVVIAIVALLIAIVLPALGHAKRSGKSAERLSAMRQCLAATTQYTDAAAGYLPYLATPGAPDLGVFPDGDWGDRLPPSYFRGQSQLWPTALLAHGIDLSHLPSTSRPGTGPERVYTYFWMTHAAVAQPKYWLHGDPPNNPSLFSGVRLSGATFPSAKGLIGFVGWTAQEAESLSAWEVGMADGSAALRSVHDPPLQVDGPYRPFGAVDWRVLTTLEGIRGRDY